MEAAGNSGLFPSQRRLKAASNLRRRSGGKHTVAEAGRPVKHSGTDFWVNLYRIVLLTDWIIAAHYMGRVCVAELKTFASCGILSAGFVVMPRLGCFWVHFSLQGGVACKALCCQCHEGGFATLSVLL